VGATVTAGLNTVLGVASLFREDVSFSGVKTAVDDLSLQIELAARLGEHGYQSVLIPAFFIVPARDDREDSLRGRLKAAENAKTLVWQVVTPKISALVDLDTQLDQATRNANQKDVDQLTQQLNALRGDLSPITEPLAKLDQQFSDIMAELRKQDPATGLTGLARLLRAEAICNLHPVFLHVKVVSSGGHNKITRSLLRTLFTGDGLTFMGGLVVRWALLDATGALQDGGILTARHAGFRPSSHRRNNHLLAGDGPSSPGFLSAVLSAGGPSLMSFPQFSAIPQSHHKCAKWPKNEKNHHRWDLTRMVS
jgi:hypothetical protein